MREVLKNKHGKPQPQPRRVATQTEWREATRIDPIELFQYHNVARLNQTAEQE
uniref:Uncharacterized protein n=1 Tax=Pseudomonas phage RVTF4 TaxID=3236931 RepID=A0AB39CCP3_9VIRU